MDLPEVRLWKVERDRRDRYGAEGQAWWTAFYA